MARRSAPGGPGDDYEPDWTEEELEAMMAARASKKSARLDADLRKHGIELNLDTPYARGELPDDDDEHPNSKAIALAQSLIADGEWEELEDLAKVQIIMDPNHAKEWRSHRKMAAKLRRLQRPRIVRFLLALVKAVVGLLVLLVVAVIIGAIIGAFLHH